jgi:hypothetical protein
MQPDMRLVVSRLFAGHLAPAVAGCTLRRDGASGKG